MVESESSLLITPWWFTQKSDVLRSPDQSSYSIAANPPILVGSGRGVVIVEVGVWLLETVVVAKMVRTVIAVVFVTTLVMVGSEWVTVTVEVALAVAPCEPALQHVRVGRKAE